MSRRVSLSRLSAEGRASADEQLSALFNTATLSAGTADEMNLQCFMSFCRTYGLVQPRRFGDKEMAACFSRAVIGKRKTLRVDRFCEAIRAAAVILEVAYADLVRRMARRLPGQSARRGIIEDSIEEKFDAMSGRTYYINARTGRTGWRPLMLFPRFPRSRRTCGSMASSHRARTSAPATLRFRCGRPRRQRWWPRRQRRRRRRCGEHDSRRCCCGGGERCGGTQAARGGSPERRRAAARGGGQRRLSTRRQAKATEGSGDQEGDAAARRRSVRSASRWGRPVTGGT